MNKNVIKHLEADLQSLRQIRDFVYLNEPCGYYCNESVGHVDHKFTNWTNLEFIIIHLREGENVEVSEHQLVCD